MSALHFILSNSSNKNICLQIYIGKLLTHSALKLTSLLGNMSYFNPKHIGQLTCSAISQ